MLGFISFLDWILLRLEENSTCSDSVWGQELEGLRLVTAVLCYERCAAWNTPVWAPFPELVPIPLIKSKHIIIRAKQKSVELELPFSFSSPHC